MCKEGLFLISLFYFAEAEGNETGVLNASLYNDISQNSVGSYIYKWKDFQGEIFIKNFFSL